MKKLLIALAVLQMLLSLFLVRYAIGTATVDAHFKIRVTEASDPIIRRSLESVSDPATRAEKEKEMRAVVNAVGSVAHEGHEEMFEVGVALFVIATIQFALGVVFLVAEIGRPNKMPQPTPGSVTDPAGAGSAPPPVVADR